VATSASPSDPLLVLATANRAKGRELAELLADLPYRIRDLSAYPGVVLPAEGEASYAQNALGKARAVTATTGEMALADDSGLSVEALGGQPGIYSARWADKGHDGERDFVVTIVENSVQGVKIDVDAE